MLADTGRPALFGIWRGLYHLPDIFYILTPTFAENVVEFT